MSSYHGWTHAPKSRGGTDPVPHLAAEEKPSIRIHGDCTIPWSWNAAATISPFPNIDVANGGILNTKFHVPAVASVEQRIYQTASAADFMEPMTAVNNPSGVGTYGYWAVKILAPGVYACRFNAGGSGGGVGGSPVGMTLFVSIEAIVLQSTPVLQSRHYHTYTAVGTGRVAADDTVIVEQADLDASGASVQYIAATLAATGNGATDRSFQGEFVVVREGDLDILDMTYEYVHP